MTDSTLAAQEARAREKIERGEIPSAIQICRRILARYPLYVEGYVLLAQAMLELGHLERAEDLFRRVLGTHPEHIEACKGLGCIARRRGNASLAAAWEQRAQELAYAEDLSPKEALTRTGLAQICLRKGFYGRGIRLLRDLLREAPERYDLQVALAEAFYRAGRAQEAIELCRAILERYPFCLKACLILGTLGLHSDWDAKAREYLERAQALDPENRMAQRLLGPSGPLPPRTVRLPWVGEEALPIDLPEGDEDLPAEAPYDGEDLDLW
jgi:tetratricopeptide (TPR) repeat protein